MTTPAGEQLVLSNPTGLLASIPRLQSRSDAHGALLMRHLRRTRVLSPEQGL